MTSITWVCAGGHCNVRVVTHSHAANPEKHPPTVDHYCRGVVKSPLTPMARWPHGGGG